MRAERRGGRARFYFVPQLPGWSGLRTQEYPAEVTLEEIQVSVKRLDDVLPTEQKVDFLKIDVEGNELAVLLGAAEVVQRHRPIILFEHAHIHNTDYGTTPEMIHDQLVGRYGLEVFSLDGRGPHSKERFVTIYESSRKSNYSRNAETNFVAHPPKSTKV